MTLDKKKQFLILAGAATDTFMLVLRFDTEAEPFIYFLAEHRRATTTLFYCKQLHPLGTIWPFSEVPDISPNKSADLSTETSPNTTF